MQQTQTTIDLSQFGGPVLCGRANGEAARKALDLDSVDTSRTAVRVTVPTDFYTVNSGFFLGLFGPSIMAAGSKEAFDAKFEIDASGFLTAAMAEYVEFALAPRLN